MSINKNYFLLLSALIGFYYNGFTQTLYDVTVGTDNVTIRDVYMTVNGVSIFQDTGATSVTATTDVVTLDSVLIDDGGVKTLRFINLNGAILRNDSLTFYSSTGVGVHTGGVDVPASSGIAAFETAMTEVISSRDLLSYLYYDNSSNIPPNADFDALWGKGLVDGDYFLVTERDGNTHFTATPLDANGNAISSARALRFGHPSGAAATASPNGNTLYDWDLGYASQNREPGQPMHLIVVPVSLFNTSETLYGMRIDNLGDADVKFFGAAETSFDDNPDNPLVPGITGALFNDSNALSDILINGDSINAAGTTPIYAKLIQGGVVVRTKLVDSDGTYEFTQLNAGTYTVIIDTTDDASTTPRIPIEWEFVGENDGTTGNNVGTVDGTTPAIVVTDSLETQNNFGIREIPQVSIGDYIWNDANGDGIQDAGEEPLAGVEVQLFDGSGAAVLGPTIPGQRDTVSTDFSSGSDNTGSINFGGNWVDFSSQGTTSQYFDRSGNEMEITGSGLGGNVIYTSRVVNQPTGYTVDEVEICFDARYSGDFTDNASSALGIYYDNGTSYVLVEELDASDLSESDQTFCYNSSSIPGLTDIEGIRFRRENYDFDSYTHISELSIVFVEADQPGNPIVDTTDVNGNYSFSTAEHGISAATQYEVRVPLSQDTLGGFDITGTRAGTTATDNNGILGGGGAYATSGFITSPSGYDGEDLDIDFGFVGYSLGNSIWWDNDDDGIKDDDEIGIAGVTVILLDDEGNTVATATTDASGNYIFNGLPEGDYQVAVTSPLNSGVLDGATISSITNTAADTDGNNDGSSTDPVGATNTPSFTAISNTITLGNSAEPTDEDDEDPNPGQADNRSNLTIDFGFEPPTTALGNAVFWDKGNDGVFDSGTDSALGGVKVYLYQDTNGDGTPNELIDSVLTDANGEYSFEDIGAGTFRLVIAPENFETGGVLSTGTGTTNGNSGDATTDNNSEGSQSGIITLSPNIQPTSDAGDNGAASFEDDDANFTFDFGFYGDGGGPVPVALLYFTAKANGNTALLEWETASELNNSHFDVERRSPNSEWEKIGEVAGNGTTQEVQYYPYTDYAPFAGVNLYRLRQVDYDGAYEYSNVEVVTFEGLGAIEVYPNPARESVTIRLTASSRESSEITLLNMLGQPLETVRVQSASDQVTIDVSEYAAGIYYVQIVQGSQTQTVKILVDN